MRGKTTFHIRWKLFFYDVIVFAVTSVFLLVLYEEPVKLTQRGELQQMLLAFVCVFACRLVGKIYGQIWRYGGIQCYMRLVCTDCVAFLIYVILESVLPVAHISFPRLLVLSTVNTMGALIMRMSYRYAYKCSNLETFSGKILAALLKIFAGIEVGETRDDQKIKVAIIGAGNVGVTLAGELLANKMASYVPKCFVDIDKSKGGREIQGLPVLSENEATFQKLKKYGIQEIIFALPSMADERRTERYLYYKNAGYKVKMYDYPKMQMAGGKRSLREFDIEELLFRAPRKLTNEKTDAYYNDKVILVTGGGGSIGSELCRQIVKMGPKKLIILDVYENGAYDLQQELRIAYGNEPGISVEIASITDSKAMERVFSKYHPQIVINAAAHKHVPLMENNCIEAINNNVFGTAVVVEMCEKYGAERFMMVSTDKAVNPTNVMGATKRMCEMIVQSASINGKVKYSATRFGNVLGSAGSVIPLFKRQIQNGGPITLTDKRIIRYFMTIPEASQLVLESGVIAHNGELLVLDMGKPIKILDLAENMIHLSGANNIKIVETGLRPGEKLYEELLVKTEELDKTENDLIFREKDKPLPTEAIREKLRMLKDVCENGDDEQAREMLRKVVPTFKRPEEVNQEVGEEVEPEWIYRKCCRALKHSEAAAFVPVEKKQNENSSFFSESELKAIGFLKYGKNVLVSRKASIYNPEQMVLGDNIRIDDFCILSGNIKLGSYIHIPAAYRRTSYFRRLCERGNRKYNFARR